MVVFFFFKKGKKRKLLFLIPPSLSTQVRRGSPFSVVDESSWAQGFQQKVPSDHKQTFRWITSKALPQLLALSYLRKIGSLRAKNDIVYISRGPD